jgi:hypothetical protein
MANWNAISYFIKVKLRKYMSLKLSRGRMLTADFRRHAEVRWWCKFASVLQYSLLLGHDAAPHQKNGGPFHNIVKAPELAPTIFTATYKFHHCVQHCSTWLTWVCNNLVTLLLCYQVVVAVVLWLSEVVYSYCHGHQLSNPFHMQLSPSITMGKWSVTELPWPSVAQTNTKIPFLMEG